MGNVILKMRGVLLYPVVPLLTQSLLLSYFLDTAFLTIILRKTRTAKHLQSWYSSLYCTRCVPLSLFVRHWSVCSCSPLVPLHFLSRFVQLPLSLLRTAQGHPMLVCTTNLAYHGFLASFVLLLACEMVAACPHLCVPVCLMVIQVELKNGETYNGILVSCDNR